VSFPRPDLDDRRFQDLVDEAKRMIPRYLPEWTNHNVSDPGVALIELFAWMTELTLYRLNRVPDRIYTSFLDLVGISPYPAAAARADVSFVFSTVPEETVLVPAGSEVSTSGDDPVVFATTVDLEVAQPSLAFSWTAPSNGTGEPDEGKVKDVQQDLVLENEVVKVFMSDPVEPGDSLYLGFRDPVGGFMLRLDVTADVEGIGVDPSNPPLVWEVWTAEGWLACTVQGDSTGGLNRNGSIQLVVPVGHLPLTVGVERAYWLRLRLLPPGPDGAGYRTSPLIRSIDTSELPRANPVRHSESKAFRSFLAGRARTSNSATARPSSPGRRSPTSPGPARPIDISLGTVFPESCLSVHASANLMDPGSNTERYLRPDRPSGSPDIAGVVALAAMSVRVHSTSCARRCRTWIGS